MSLPQRTPAPRDPRSLTFLQGEKPPVDDAAELLREGLIATPAAIPPRFFYDELGSRLFAAITALDEYYPTRTEARILRDHLPAIAAALPVTGCTLVDVGAGNCEKAAGLFATVQPARYVAVDISTDFLRDALQQLQRRFPAIDMCGVATDFAQRLELPPAVPVGRRLFFYPGSSIGNFSPAQAVVFLQSLREQMHGDGVLWLGVDLQKDKAVLERAYDDELGVTAAFNKNVLRHVNQLAGTDFDLDDWRHVARYDEAIGRIEMHLEVVRDLVVTWPGGRRSFASGERIHTENSYKYTVEGCERLLADAGLRSAGCWTDPDRWFGVFVAAPR
jgi:dimethylhistidine N-methyltransferase